MNGLDKEQREQILTKTLAARTSEQLKRATRELDAWVAAHPDDTGIQWAYEQMALVELALKEATPAMTQSQPISEASLTDEREQLITRTLAAYTPTQIGKVKQDLRQWFAAHPEDIGMEDLLEVLALRTPTEASVILPSQEAA